MRRRLALVLLALLCTAPRAHAQDEPSDRRLSGDVDRWVKDLASDDYATREAARKRLQAVAREARPLLEARREDPDPEVRRTVEALLADLGDTGPVPSTAGELGALGLVTFAAEGPFAQVAEAWERGVGGRLKAPGANPDAVVKVALTGVPYFEALAAVLRPAGLDATEGFDEVGQAFLAVRDPAAAPPTACAGPFRLDVDSVTTTRSLRPGVRPRHSLLLRLAWSPDVQVTSFSTPEIVSASDERGGGFAGVDGRGTTYGIGGGRRLAMLQVTLEPEEGTTGDRIATLEAKARVRVRHGRETVAFPELSGADPWPRTVKAGPGGGKGDTRLVLESFGEDPDRRGWVMGVLTATLARGIAAEGVSASLQTSDGALRPMLELSSRVASSDGVLRLTLRAAGVGPDVRPTALHVTWFSSEREVLVPFVLKGVPLR